MPPSRQSQWASSVEPWQAALSRPGLRRAEKDIPLTPHLQKNPSNFHREEDVSPLPLKKACRLTRLAGIF